MDTSCLPPTPRWKSSTWTEDGRDRELPCWRMRAVARVRPGGATTAGTSMPAFQGPVTSQDLNRQPCHHCHPQVSTQVFGSHTGIQLL